MGTDRGDRAPESIRVARPGSLLRIIPERTCFGSRPDQSHGIYQTRVIARANAWMNQVAERPGKHARHATRKRDKGERDERQTRAGFHDETASCYRRQTIYELHHNNPEDRHEGPRGFNGYSGL